MAKAAKKLGKKYSVQGNLDPCVLFAPKEQIEDRVKDILFKAEPAAATSSISATASS